MCAEYVGLVAGIDARGRRGRRGWTRLGSGAVSRVVAWGWCVFGGAGGGRGLGVRESGECGGSAGARDVNGSGREPGR
jgi:hypothetical protein